MELLVDYVRLGNLSTWLLSSNGLGYHGETGSPWYGWIAQLVRACPEGPHNKTWLGKSVAVVLVEQECCLEM
jgi:hypothetical protein